jgi:adenosylhomocysteine nucleosidase
MVFRGFVRDWLRNLAGQKMRQKVVEAAREGPAETGESPRPEEPPLHEQPCNVGVIFALAIEAGGLEDRLRHVVRIRGHGFSVRQGQLKGRSVAVVRSGPGRKAARHATEALLSGHKPQWVISAGFAGGLSPQVRRNDLVMADGLVDTAGARLVIDLKVDPASLAQTPGVHVGRLLCVDQIVRLPQEKRALGQKHDALAADMESFAAAEVCRERQVRFLAIRVVSDSVDDELPPEVEHFMRQKTRAAKFGAALGAVFRRLSSIKDMWKLKENALVASGRLGEFLASTIEQLVPLPPAPQ